MRTRGGVMFFVLIILVLSGCASVGPGTITRDRFDYNASITESWKRQILLNIVKIRYIEPVSFVDVGQIVSGYSLETGVNLGSRGTLSSFSSSASIEAGVAGRYTDRPTITYTPMTGNAFIKSLMTPLPPSHLFFAIQSGVPADMIFKLGVASINGLRNESATIAGYKPAEEKFRRVIELISSLQLEGAISIKIVKHKDKQEDIFISFLLKTGNAEVLTQVRELRDLLGLDQATDQYNLVLGGAPENKREIAMHTFSMMHILAFMAARVEVPEKDMSEKRASPGIREASGKAGREGGFLVNSSDREPQDASVSVKYRNHWFWVDDRDLASKRAISFIVLIFSLADTGKHESLPQITIPAQ